MFRPFGSVRLASGFNGVHDVLLAEESDDLRAIANRSRVLAITTCLNDMVSVVEQKLEHRTEMLRFDKSKHLDMRRADTKDTNDAKSLS